MDLGMIGLGRMGANLVRRLLRDGHRAVVYDVDPASVAALVSEGAEDDRVVPLAHGALRKRRLG
jgi:6-phosphogluconate dehydrogenase